MKLHIFQQAMLASSVGPQIARRQKQIATHRQERRIAKRRARLKSERNRVLACIVHGQGGEVETNRVTAINAELKGVTCGR